jgi:hypothetical protein
MFYRKECLLHFESDLGSRNLGKRMRNLGARSGNK